MNYEIVAIPNFRKELKKLSKKYPSLKEDFSDLIQSLQETPIQGVSLGKNCFIIRMSIKSKGKGKSGGARVISLVKINKNTVFLLSVFDKAEKENISNRELKALIELIEGEEQE